MKKILILLFIPAIIFNFSSCGSPSSSGSDPAPEPIEVPDSIYKTSNGYPANFTELETKLIGTWMYSNNLFFKFNNDHSWSYYQTYNTSNYIYYEGTWSVHQMDGIFYLKLKYISMGITDSAGNHVLNNYNPDPNPSGLNRADYHNRWQIVEIYADNDKLALNPYREKDSVTSDFFNDWVHNNFDYYDNLWSYTPTPGTLTSAQVEDGDDNSGIKNEKNFAQSCYTESGGIYNLSASCDTDPEAAELNQIFSKYIPDYSLSTPPAQVDSTNYNNYISLIPNDKEFIKTCYPWNSTFSLYVRNTAACNSETDMDRLTQIFSEYNISGEVVWSPLKFAPFAPVHNNRTGILSFNNAGTVAYSQTSPFFNVGMPSAFISDIGFSFSTSPSGTQNAQGIYTLREEGSDVYLNWTSESPLLSNLDFQVMIIRDKNMLLTFPFSRQ